MRDFFSLGLMRIVPDESPSYYSQLRNVLQKHFFFAYSALIMSTLKGSTGRFSNFRAQSQNITGDWIFPDSKKPMSPKRADIHLIAKII